MRLLQFPSNIKTVYWDVYLYLCLVSLYRNMMKYVHVVMGPKKNQHKHNPPSFPFSFRWKKPVDRHCCASTGEAKIQQGLVYSASESIGEKIAFLLVAMLTVISHQKPLPTCQNQKLPPPKQKKALNGDFPEAHSHFFKNPTLTSLCIISF